MVRRALAMVVCGACGGGGGTPADAAPDGTPLAVETLPSCTGTINATVSDTPTSFVPQTTMIKVGGVVRFMITSEHFVITTSDPALTVGRGQTKCFQFNAAGSYGFACGVHGFIGSIVVQ